MKKKAIGFVIKKIHQDLELKRDTVIFKKKSKKSVQNFYQAVISGRRNGSGKVALEFSDALVKLMSGSPATE